MNHQQALTLYIASLYPNSYKQVYEDVVVSPGSVSTPIAMVMAEHPEFVFIFMSMKDQLLFLL